MFFLQKQNTYINYLIKSVTFDNGMRKIVYFSSFLQKHQFPGIIGCVDCTHVSIIAPHTDDPEFPEYVYVNRKNYHSINVQLVRYDQSNIKKCFTSRFNNYIFF